MSEELNVHKTDLQSADLHSVAQKKIVLPEDVQIEMMKFFLRTSIPKIKRARQEKARLSKINDGSDT